MAVRPGTLDNPEQGLALGNRDAAEEKPPVRRDAASELKALRERIDAARGLTIKGESDRHCFDCWSRGRNAALKAIEGE